MAAELPVPEPVAVVGPVLAGQLAAELAAGRLAAAETAGLPAAVPSAVQPKPRKQSMSFTVVKPVHKLIRMYLKQNKKISSEHTCRHSMQVWLPCKHT